MKQIFEKTIKFYFPDNEDYRQKMDPVILIDYLNDIAGKHSEALGYSLESLLRNGYSWILLNWNIQINELPESGDNIKIQTWISRTRRCFANREFLVRDNQDNTMVFASSRWIFYNLNKQVPGKLFPEFSDKRIIIPERACSKSIFGSSILQKDRCQTIETSIDVQKIDIDMLNHVHNSRYIQWSIDNKPEKMIKQYKLSYLQVSYNHEVKYPGKVTIRQFFVPPEEKSKILFYDEIRDDEKERLSAEIFSEWVLQPNNLKGI